MNNFTNIVIPIHTLFFQLWYILHPRIFINKTLWWMIEIWMQNHLVIDDNCYIINL
jgi:hypothetical protein